MFRPFISSGQILSSINFVELPVEFIFVANMLVLLILYLLSHEQITSGKFTVLSISYLDVLSISVLDNCQKTITLIFILQVPFNQMTIMQLHNTLAESHERVLALQDELAGERGRKRAIKRALKAAIKDQRGGRNIQSTRPVLILVDCPNKHV